MCHKKMILKYCHVPHERLVAEASFTLFGDTMKRFSESINSA